MIRSERARPSSGLALLAAFVAAGAVGAAAEPSAEPNLRRTHVVRAFEANRDAIVNVNTTHVVRQRFGLFDDDPFFRRFFDGLGPRPLERDVRRTSLGSGFIVHEDGYTVTNGHVVDNAEEVEVILADGTHLPAAVLASNTREDVAVLKIDPPADVELRPVALGDSADLMIGEPIVAIGNPLGYEHSVTSGIISATERSLRVTREWELAGLIQIDAPINPGNSGGPLFNAYGRVIGINTVIRGDAQNIGFAIPVGRLRDMMGDLLSPLILNRVEIGGRIVERRQITGPDTLEVTPLWQPEGEAVEDERSVTHINGRRVEGIVDAYVSLLALRPGEQIVLEGESGRIVTEARRAPPHDGERLARRMLGVAVRELTAAEARRAGLRRPEGLWIEAVERGGPADRAGLRPGEVIVQLGYHRITDLDSLALLLGEAEGGMEADVHVIRHGRLGRARLMLRSAAAGAL